MGGGRKKIEIKKIEKESSRMVTFSKRKKGLFRKAKELRSKSDAEVAILVFSPRGKPFTDGNIATFNDALNAFSNSTTTNRSDLDDHHGAGAGTSTSTSTNTNGPRQIRQWLDNMNIENCDQVEQLVQWREQLQKAKESIENEELLRSNLP